MQFASSHVCKVEPRYKRHMQGEQQDGPCGQFFVFLKLFVLFVVAMIGLMHHEEAINDHKWPMLTTRSIWKYFLKYQWFL